MIPRHISNAVSRDELQCGITVHPAMTETDNRTQTRLCTSISQLGHNRALKKTDQQREILQGTITSYEQQKCCLTSSLRTFELLADYIDLYLFIKWTAAFKWQWLKIRSELLSVPQSLHWDVWASNGESNRVMTVSLHSDILRGIVIICDR